MARVAVVGGHGKIALQLHPLLVAAGHVPVALVRDEGYRAELEGLGAEVGIVDLENDDAEHLAGALEGCTAVVFAAGGGPDGSIERKRTVDLGGSTKSAAAAAAVGIRRFVQVSAIHVDDEPAADASPVWRAYVAAKRDADAALRATDLAWTIVRPGRLTDEPGTGRVAVGELGEGSVPRADVAAVVAAALADDSLAGVQLDLLSGPTPIAEALAALHV